MTKEKDTLIRGSPLVDDRRVRPTPPPTRVATGRDPLFTRKADGGMNGRTKRADVADDDAVQSWRSRVLGAPSATRVG